MAMNQPFTTASPYVVSYSYNDLINGLGYVVFYGVKYKDSGGEKAYLSTQLVDAGESYSATVTSDSSGFNAPRTAKGTAIITGNATGDTTWTFSLQHYDGATATEIGTSTMGTTTDGIDFVNLLELTETLFAKGDILRLVATKTSGTIKSSSANPFKIYIPFKIN